jgi:uncharacterized protein (TIGR03067 family)
MALILLVVCGSFGLQADDKEKKKPDDLERLQGTWRVVTLIEQGKEVPKKETDLLEIVIDKDTYTALEKGVPEAKYTIKLDASKTPKHIDFKIAGGKNKGEVEAGIYRFEDDKVRMVVNEDPKGGRPTAFDGKDAANYSVILLEKKPAKDKDGK